MNDEPIFLTGVYRSGTTLPTNILNSHPELRIISDTLQFFRFYLGKYDPIRKRYSEVVEEANWRLEERMGIDVPTERILAKLRNINQVRYRDLFKTIMVETFCQDNDGLRWGEKSVLEWTNIPTFLSMYPKGKAIHIIRDPRDVLASYREFTIEPKSRYLDAIFTCLHSMQWAASKGSALPDDRYFILKHEDLVTSPEDTTIEICDFLGIEFVDEMLNTTKYTNNKGDNWEDNSAFDDLGGGISSKSAKRWPSRLQHFELNLVESIIDDYLFEYFGYELSDMKNNKNILEKIWDKLGETPLIQQRLKNWLNTRNGVEGYPSDPTAPSNWSSDE